MSNCIEIDNASVRFAENDIDAEKLLELVYRVKDLPDAPRWKDDADGYFAWWFLARNIEFHEYVPGSLAGVTVHFGYGNSTHTVRDFLCLLDMLKKFMFKDKLYTFLIRDEYDGFQETMEMRVNFKEGRPCQNTITLN